MIHTTRRWTGAADPDTSVASGIARALADDIVRGTLAPGTRLRQDEIATEFGVSHVPVREAFRALEAQGLLVSKPRCGVSVSPLDPAVVLEATEMRAALEGLALRFALPHLGPRDLDVARRALLDGEAGAEIAAWEAANRRFHLAITQPCGMPRLMAQIRDLQRSTARFLFAAWKELDWRPRSDAEHRAILDAIARGDGDDACVRLESHVRAAGHALVARLEQQAVAP